MGGFGTNLCQLVERPQRPARALVGSSKIRLREWASITLNDPPLTNKLYHVSLPARGNRDSLVKIGAARADRDDGVARARRNPPSGGMASAMTVCFLL